MGSFDGKLNLQLQQVWVSISVTMGNARGEIRRAFFMVHEWSITADIF